MDRTDFLYDLAAIWAAASEISPFFDRLDIDWDEKYREFIGRMLNEDDERRMHFLLAEFTNLLGDGHTDYNFPRNMSRGGLPFRLLYSAGEYYIREISSGSERFLLSRIISINGRSFGELLDGLGKYAYHIGRFIWPGRLENLLTLILPDRENELETDAGVYHFELCREAAEMTDVKSRMPESRRRTKAGGADIRILQDGTLYAALGDFMHPDAGDNIRKVIAEEQPRKVIIDVRNNIGGITMYAAGVAELFISGEIHPCRKRTRTMTGLDMACASQYAGMSREELEALADNEELIRCLRVGKRENYMEYTDSWGKAGQSAAFDGRVDILTSRATISAAEDFVAMFRYGRRARIIGEPTCGTTGTPFLKALRCGGRLRICSVAYSLADGTGFIGRGIEPDVYLDTDIEQLKKGRDNILEYALMTEG